MMAAFTLAHLSDPHLAPPPAPGLRELAGKRALGYMNWTRNRTKVHRRDVLDALVADMQALRPDHIAVTGDIINIGLEAEFEPARAWLESVGSPEHVTVVPGNHDAYVRATQHRFAETWGDYLRGDDAAAGAAFPFLRRRGPLALIGVSSAVPTPPLMATGRLGRAQLEALERILTALSNEKAFRVLLIHHPLRSQSRAKRLTDSSELLALLKQHGVELILHGHDHIHSTMWFDGPRGRIPAIGVPSASAVAHGHTPAAAYNLFSIEREGEAWRCEQTVRGFGDAQADEAASRCCAAFVMRGLDPRIHHSSGFSSWTSCRVKPGNDDRSHISQRREQREAEQRQRAEDESEREGPETAAARLLGNNRLRHRSRDQRVFALHHAARDIVGDGVDDRRHLVRLRDHDAAEAGVLHKAIDALVAAHRDMRDHVDPQPRVLALADAAIEQIDLIRNLREQRIERLVQDLQPRHFGVAQIDHDTGTVGRLDPRLPQRIAQADRTLIAGGLAFGILRV